MTRSDDLARIHDAIMAAADAIEPFTPGDIEFEIKSERGDPLTAADEAADRALREVLPAKGEGWLSEESIDDPVRLGCRRVWVVDPIDGTREFIDGIPEWCISVGLVEDGLPGCWRHLQSGHRGVGDRLAGNRSGVPGALLIRNRPCRS